LTNGVDPLVDRKPVCLQDRPQVFRRGFNNENDAGAEAELQKLVRILATYNTARLKREAIVYTIDHQAKSMEPRE
jgi:hypothetical protein